MPDSVWTFAGWLAGLCIHFAIIAFIGRHIGVLAFRPRRGRWQR